MTAERQTHTALVAVSLAVVLLVPAVPVAAQTAPAVLSDVTVTSQPDAINIFGWTSRETKYRAELIEAPRRLIIDLGHGVRVAQDPVHRRRRPGHADPRRSVPAGRLARRLRPDPRRRLRDPRGRQRARDHHPDRTHRQPRDGPEGEHTGRHGAGAREDRRTCQG